MKVSSHVPVDEGRAFELAVSSLLLLSLLGASACGVDGEGEPEESATNSLSSDNGLSGNGLSTNGLSSNGLSGNGLSGNGLSNNGLSSNGLSSNGLSASAFNSWFHSGNNNTTSRAYAAQLMKYVVRCACAAGVNRTFKDTSTGTTYTWVGNLGLATGWCGGTAATVAEQEWVTACLLAHVNANSSPVIASTLSVPISVRTENAERNLAASTEELDVFAVPEGTYFGNLFNLQSTSSPKGTFVARYSANSAGPTAAPAIRQLGRTCFIDGCPTNGSGVVFAGGLGAPDPFLASAACSSNADCAGTNNGLTPICDITPFHSVCRTRTSCSGSYEPTSCTDPQGRSWARTIHLALPSMGEASPVSGTATLRSTASSNCSDCTNASGSSYVTGLSGGGRALVATYLNVAATSSYFTVRVRYKGNGTLSLTTTAFEMLALFNPPPVVTTYSSKTLTCPSGSWCWADWTNIKLIDRVSGYKAYNKVEVKGLSGTAAPDVDMAMVFATR